MAVIRRGHFAGLRRHPQAHAAGGLLHALGKLRLSFHLPKGQESQTLHQVELAMLQRVKEIAEHMLQA